MARTIMGTRLSHRPQERDLAKFVAVAAFVLIVGFMLWIGVLSSGSLGSILYVAAVIGVAAFLAYTDRKNATNK